MNLLRGVRVLEVSLFSPDGLGGHLADLGADVIKVDEPGGGGFRGPLFPPQSIEDLQWNRGKRSVTVNLKTAQGRSVLRRLAAEADVFINGLRQGSAERLGIAFNEIAQVNPKIAYCTINGMGSYGPYVDLPTHGLSFDCFAGLTPPVTHEDGHPRLPGNGAGLIGVLAGPLFGALGVLAALHRARADGLAQHVEVSQVDAAIVWNFQVLTPLANGRRPRVSVADSMRYQYYETKDGKYVVFMALEDKFWKRFCQALDRQDLYDAGNLQPSEHREHQIALRNELASIFRSRTRREWTEFFISTNVAGAPAFDGTDLFDDQHVIARDLVYDQPTGVDESMRMLGCCIKAAGKPFAPAPPPKVGEHTQEILQLIGGYSEEEVAKLRTLNAI